jgi:hypothetical protein
MFALLTLAQGKLRKSIEEKSGESLLSPGRKYTVYGFS